jgi:hypothetical protein
MKKKWFSKQAYHSLKFADFSNIKFFSLFEKYNVKIFEYLEMNFYEIKISYEHCNLRPVN